MNNQGIETWLRQVISEAARVDVTLVDRDADLKEEIGLDSLSYLEVLAEIEERFDFTFEDEALEGPNTIAYVVEKIIEKLAPSERTDG
jgi:acyl carrier protein